MKITIDRIALDFMKTLMAVSEKITPEAVLYWARHKEELVELLEKKDFEMLTQINEQAYDLAAVPETNRKALWNKRFIDNQWMDDFIEFIPTKHPATQPIHIHGYQLNTPLYGSELVEELGGIESLEVSAFTLSQIYSLCRLHPGPDKATKQKQLLSYSQSNYFPFRKKDGTMMLYCIGSKQDYGKHKRWKAWFRQLDCHTYMDGMLLIKEEIEGQILHSIRV